MSTAKPAFPVLRRGHPLAQGLALALPCYEGSGLLASDVSGKDNTGTLSSGAMWVGGQSGWCLSFDGIAGKITLPAVLPASETLTAVIWVYRTSGNINQALISWENSGGAWESYISNGTYWFEKAAVIDVDSGIASAVNTWEHVCWTIQLDRKPRLYINGNLRFTSSNAAALVSTTRVNAIGFDFSNQFFGGSLDIPLVYNRALSQPEIAALYADSWQMMRRPSLSVKAKAGSIFVGGRKRWSQQMLAVMQAEQDESYSTRLALKRRSEMRRMRSLLEFRAEQYAAQKRLEAATYTLVLAEV